MDSKRGTIADGRPDRNDEAAGTRVLPKKKSGLSRGFRLFLAIAAVALAIFLLHRVLSRYSPDEILQSMRSIPASRVVLSLTSAGASYLCLTAFDWLALRYVEK